MMKHDSLMEGVLRGLTAASLLAFAACSDATTAPPIDPGDDPPASFEVEIPESVTQGQAFPLSATALDEAGLPETTWQGTVTLTASDGTLAPASVELINGTATTQVTLTGYAGAVTIRAANGSVQSVAVAMMVLSGQAPARLEIVPAAALLTSAGATQPFTVLAFDAQGAPTTATQVSWTSNDAATLAVDAAGLATAQTAVGSAMITASANGVASAPAVVLVASPAENAVLVADSLIVSGVVPVDPAAAYEPGWQYRIRLSGAAPAVGDIVIGTGAQPLAGRVVDASDVGGGETELIVELLPLNQLFTNLRIDESIPMIEQVGGTAPQSRVRGPADDLPAGFAATAETEFTLGRFKCTASGEVPSLDLPSPTLDIDPDLHLQIGYDNGLERLAVGGTVTADAGYKPVFEAKFTGEATCETVVKTFTIPANGIISWFYGVQVPLGFGFTLDGKLEIAEVGFDIRANATATVELGISCPGGGSCTGLDTFDMTRDGSLEFIAPDPSEQFRVELGAHAFVFARPFLGSLFTNALSFEFVDATAGLKQSIDLATTHYQVEDTTYASSFNLQFLAKIGAGKDLTTAIQNLGKLLGTDLGASFNLVEIDDTLATSPKGTFTITPESVAPGDTTELGEMATFTVELNPVDYLGLYAVDKVEFFWKHEDSTSFTLGPGRPSCVDVASSSGQTTFECETDFLEEHGGEQTFYAFVHAKLFGVPLPLPLEVAVNGSAVVDVEDCPLQDYLTLTTQAEVDSVAGVCQAFSLNIREAEGTTDPIVDLTPLASLKWVYYEAWIENTTQLADLTGLSQLRLTERPSHGDGAGLIIRHNQALTSLNGLAAEVDSLSGRRIGNVQIGYNPVLSDISALANVLPDGAVLDGFGVNDSPVASIAPLQAVDSVTGNFRILSTAVTSVADLDGIHMARRFAIVANPALTAINLALPTVLGDIVIEQNDALTSLTLAVADVGVDAPNGMNFSDNDALQSVSITVGSGITGLNLTTAPALSSLQTSFAGGVVRLFNVSDTGIPTITNLGITRIEGDNSGLYVSKNPNLTNISGLRSVTYVQGLLSVINNEQLCVEDWLYDIEVGGSTMVSGNGECN